MDDRELLLDAILEKDIEKIKSLVKNNPAIINQDNTEGTPVHDAVFEGDLEILKLLYELGADLTKSGGHSDQQAILWAAQEGSWECVEWLFSHGEWGQIKMKEKRPLTAAVLGGNIQVVKLFLENGADPDWDYGEDRSALECTGDPEMIRLLSSYSKENNDPESRIERLQAVRPLVKGKLAKKDREGLRENLYNDCKREFESYVSKYGRENVIGFAIYGPDNFTVVSQVGATKAGLEAYKKKTGSEGEFLPSVVEWDLMGGKYESNEVNAILQQTLRGCDDKFYNTYVKDKTSIIMEVMKKLVKDGVFGSKKERDNTFITVCDPENDVNWSKNFNTKIMHKLYLEMYG